MPSNQTYIEKADLQLAELTTDGGRLETEQAKTFYRIAIKSTKLLPMCTTVPMKADTYELPKTGFTGRVLRRAGSTKALPEASRSKPALGRMTLTVKKFKAEVRIPYDVVEDNIENGTFVQTVMALLGPRVGADMEEFVIRGDTASADPEYAEQDGILKLATSFVVNFGGARLSKTGFKQLLQTIPSEFLTPRHVFITSNNAAIDYMDSLSNRQTPVGDDAVTKGAMSDAFGRAVVDIPLFPENIGTGSVMTNVLLLDPKNIHVGMHRDVRIETDRDISAEELIVVATTRFGVQYAHEPAVAKMTEVLASAGP